MSIFEFNLNRSLIGSMEIQKELLISTYISIDLKMRHIIDGLANDNVYTIINPDKEERDRLLKWLSDNPFILRSQQEVFAAPLFYTYQERRDNVVIQANDNKLYADLREILKNVEIGDLHIDHNFSSLILAKWVLEGKKTLKLSLDDFRKLLGVKKDNYKSFSQLERILSRVKRKCKKIGVELNYEREPIKYTRYIIINIKRKL